MISETGAVLHRRQQRCGLLRVVSNGSWITAPHSLAGKTCSPVTPCTPAVCEEDGDSEEVDERIVFPFGPGAEPSPIPPRLLSARRFFRQSAFPPSPLPSCSSFLRPSLSSWLPLSVSLHCKSPSRHIMCLYPHKGVSSPTMSPSELLPRKSPPTWTCMLWSPLEILLVSHTYVARSLHIKGVCGRVAM